MRRVLDAVPGHEAARALAVRLDPPDTPSQQLSREQVAAMAVLDAAMLLAVWLFWRALVAGVDGVRRVAGDRWPADAVPGGAPLARTRPQSRAAAARTRTAAHPRPGRRRGTPD